MIKRDDLFLRRFARLELGDVEHRADALVLRALLGFHLGGDHLPGLRLRNRQSVRLGNEADKPHVLRAADHAHAARHIFVLADVAAAVDVTLKPHGLAVVVLRVFGRIQIEDAELVIYLKSKLNRPMRVCGMVKNVGEPGGGPFLAVNPDGTVSLQVLESSQIDMSDPAKKAMFEKGTHFNPVDLVCAVKNHKGEKYNLPDYVDKNTGFISYKSKDGRELKALELPGLWNGAMSDWNTVFVEVPIETFNPVKTVNDLLRPEHQ